MIGAGILTAVELAGVLAFSKMFLLVFHWPALSVIGWLDFPESGPEFAPPLVFTLICGGQAFAFAYAIGRFSPRLMKRAPIRAESPHDRADSLPAPDSQ